MTRSPSRRNCSRLLLPLSLLAIWGCSNQDTPGNLGSIEQDTGAVVAGVIHDTNGQATPDAVVTLEAMIAGRAASVATHTGLVSEPKAAKSVRTAVADAAGRYAIADLTAGDYLLTTSLRDHAGASNRFTVSESAAALAETTVVDIQLLPTGTILGLTTRENAVDHSGTIVFVDGTSHVAVTDLAGNYSLTGVPIGVRPVHATYPGFLDDATTATLTAAGDSTTAGDLFLRLSANLPPVIDTIGATTVAAGTPTDFSADGHDPDGTIVLWEWDFQNDGVFDVASGVDASASFVYATAGQYLAKLRMTDNQGAHGLAVVDVVVLTLPGGAIFVADTGSDTNIGSPQQPVRTIAQGLVLAQAAALDSVLVTTGEFPGVVNLIDGISIFGGRDPLLWGDTAGYSHLTGDVQPLHGSGINSATRVEGLHVESNSATLPGQSSVAISLVDCGALLEFVDCIVTAGNGAPGAAGINGATGAPGGGGSSGLDGFCDSTPSRPGGGGGSGFFNGGSGGSGGNAGGNGSDGTPGVAGGGGGGNGGAPGYTGAIGSSAGNGLPGAAGTNGTNGSPGAVLGSIVGGAWQPSTSGSGNLGTGGRGGGGGGGGGGQKGTFIVSGVGGSGGGGGGGGYSGQPGTGGHGGGGSFGFVLDNATPTVTNCTINMGSGGGGGTGGNGGGGGAGGAGGIPGGRDCSDVGLGGFGGAGGAGGWGGSGAGGPGGSVFGIIGANGGAVADTGTITFVANGLPGAGGAGGVGADSAPDGIDGAIGTTFSF